MRPPGPPVRPASDPAESRASLRRDWCSYTLKNGYQITAETAKTRSMSTMADRERVVIHVASG